jgi:predicted nucleic-acid-binding protein
MIGLDTNVLARYYIDDATDEEAARQREAAQRLIESGNALLISKTVLLELEWVMRGYYGFKPAEVSGVLTHLLSLEHVEIEDRDTVQQAIDSHAAGLDFADALHHAGYRRCDAMATFDDRRFARRARRLGLLPPVTVCH